jgi:hypothetical protein
MTIYDEALKDLENLVSTTCDGNQLLARTKLALETARKEHDLLELYQLKDELKEHYAVNDSVLKGQEILDRLRQVCEEINIKEEELEEMK